MSKPDKKKKLLAKHKPLKKADVERAKKEAKKAKEKYAVDTAAVEKALTEFLSIKDSIKWEGKVIAMVRRPSMKELKELIPSNVKSHLDDPQGIPAEKFDDYDELFFGNMAKLIVTPKKTAKQWKETANPWFLRLFFEHIANIAKVMDMQVEGF